MRTLCLLTSLLLTLAACAGSQAPVERSADELFRMAQQAVEDDDFEEAQNLLDQIRDEHPFSRFAVEAELVAADMKYRDKKYEEAAAAYRSFEELHPTHARVSYAMYRRAMAYLMVSQPPDRDQTPNRNAAEAFQKLLFAHPDSEYAPDAREKLAEVRSKLADHELYVAKYYVRKKKYDAALSRLQGLVQDYPDTPNRDEALRLALEVQDKRQQAQDLE